MELEAAKMIGAGLAAMIGSCVNHSLCVLN